jgi:hypothetical protein
MAIPRTGLLIIRAWVEPGSAAPLRAQVRVTDDVSAGLDQVLTLASPEEAGALVDVWLQRILKVGREDC